MRSIYLFAAFILISLQSCAQETTESTGPARETLPIHFAITDYFTRNSELDKRVQSIFDTLSASDRVAQLIMPAIGNHGQPKEKIDRLIREGKIGGLLMLNGTKEEFTTWIHEYNTLNKKNGKLPFLYSADAEPSLINRKITKTPPIAKANTLKTIEEVRKCAQQISDELNQIGINYNFAPVVDMSPNKTVGWRSFGHEPDSVIPWSNAFIETTQRNNIIATAKHFPGHGYVVGDTHEKLVFIDGEMKELQNYPPIIEANVLSIMVAHIAVKNNNTYNTEGMPATTSRRIVTDLLRDSLNFKGLIVTDALNMGGVKNVPEAEVLAVQAGCDIVLMPLDADKAYARLLEKYTTNEQFKLEVDNSVKRIIRAKLALGLMNEE
jgi:beta-N-acetylhexosaminidase